MRRVLRVLLVIAVLAVTAWWALALVFAGPQPAWVRYALAAMWALSTLAVLLWVRPFRRALTLWGIGMLAILVWWGTIQPSNERDWQPEVAQLPSVDVRGDLLTRAQHPQLRLPHRNRFHPPLRRSHLRSFQTPRG